VVLVVIALAGAAPGRAREVPGVRGPRPVYPERAQNRCHGVVITVLVLSDAWVGGFIAQVGLLVSSEGEPNLLRLATGLAPVEIGAAAIIVPACCIRRNQGAGGLVVVFVKAQPRVSATAYQVTGMLAPLHPLLLVASGETRGVVKARVCPEALCRVLQALEAAWIAGRNRGEGIVGCRGAREGCV